MLEFGGLGDGHYHLLEGEVFSPSYLFYYGSASTACYDVTGYKEGIEVGLVDDEGLLSYSDGLLTVGALSDFERGAEARVTVSYGKFTDSASLWVYNEKCATIVEVGDSGGSGLHGLRFKDCFSGGEFP